MVDMIYKIKDLAEVDIKGGYIKSYDELEEYLYEACENACIYYKDCFEIVQQAGATDFSFYIEEFGATTINAIAFCVLREEMTDFGLFNELTPLLDDCLCEECGWHKSECVCDEEE